MERVGVVLQVRAEVHPLKLGNCERVSNRGRRQKRNASDWKTLVNYLNICTGAIIAIDFLQKVPLQSVESEVVGVSSSTWHFFLNVGFFSLITNLRVVWQRFGTLCFTLWCFLEFILLLLRRFHCLPPLAMLSSPSIFTFFLHPSLRWPSVHHLFEELVYCPATLELLCTCKI